MAAPRSSTITETEKRIAAAWRERLTKAQDAKKDFRERAEFGMEYTFGSQNLGALLPKLKLGGGSAAGIQPPEWKHRTNKGYEMLRIFGAALVHKNPTRQVTPRTGAPMAQLLSLMLSAYLNYTPHELNLKSSMRLATDEALIKGAGMLLTARDEDSGLIGSFFDTIDHLLLDPTATGIEDCRWGATLCREPRDDLKERYGRSALSGVRPNAGLVDEYGIENSNKKKTEDDESVYYWKIYSRIGLGLKDLQGEKDETLRDIAQARAAYVVLPVGGGDPFLVQRGWPIPFFADNRWPWSIVAFNPVPAKLWPEGLLIPALSELLFMDWGMGRVFSKINTTHRDFIVMHEGNTQELSAAVAEGKDLTILKVPMQEGPISEHIAFLQHPPMQRDIIEVLQAAETRFDKRMGTDELLYGTTSQQMRSAQEAAIKDRNTRLRVDDMADRVEDWQSEVARKEALAVRWLLTPQDMDKLGLFPPGAWPLYQQGDLERIARELEYRIEAGSIRKPNRERLLDQTGQLFHDLMPVYQSIGPAALEPLNQLLLHYLKANDVANPERFLIQPPPAPPMAPPGPGPAGPGPGGPMMPPDMALRGPSPGNEMLPPEMALPPLPSVPQIGPLTR